MNRLWICLIALCLTLPLAAQTNRKIQELQERRGALQKEIAASEQMLLSTQKDVRSQLNDLKVLGGQIDMRRKLIASIVDDMKALDSELVTLRGQLGYLQRQLDDRREKYATSVKYRHKNRSMEEKLMFIFSAEELSQIYRRLRYVREYGDFQRRQAEEIVRKQQEIQAKQAELTQVRNEKSNLLGLQSAEQDKLEKQEQAQRTLVASLQKKQKGLQNELAQKRRQAERLNAQIDRLIEAEIAAAKKRAEADSIRLAGGDSTKVEYPAADPEMFESEEERTDLSYAFGSDIGYNIAQSGMPIQLVWIVEAMQNVRDNNAKMNEDAVNQYLQYYFMIKRPAENAAASKAWLEKIEKKSGVKKTESGLLYKVNNMGDTTVMAKDPRDVVKVHYTGRTREGKVFDTSKFANRTKEQQEMLKQRRPDDYDKDEPVEFPLNRVIPGWTEGMQLVGKGGTITLWIPSDLAYGPRGAGRDIGPNEALEFEVELIDVTPYEEPAPADSTATAETPAVEPAK